jgi:Ca2+-binding EF-hand superfamily protein
MGAFSDDQVHIYKECFRLMDVDKDGIISKTDLRAAFDNVGKDGLSLLKNVINT